MQIWYMEPYPIGDRRMPHHMFPPKMLSPDQLQSVTGVVSYKVDLDDTLNMKKRLSRIRTERNQVATDVMTLDNELLDLDTKLDVLYEPTEKDEEQLFMVLDGCLYYDVEYEDSEWIRMQLERGDLIVIPKGRIFRCTTTPQNFAKVQRFGVRNNTNQG